jgi:hypothetical protein
MAEQTKVLDSATLTEAPFAGSRSAQPSRILALPGAILRRLSRYPRSIATRRQLERDILTVTRDLGAFKVTELRDRTLAFVRELSVTDSQIGLYRYSRSQAEPCLYSSVYAVLIRDLYRDLASLTSAEREEWGAYFKRYQSDDGLFRDPAVSNEIAETSDWWGWRHLTLHVVMALCALGTRVDKSFAFLDPVRTEQGMLSWLRSRNWKNNAAEVSNQIQNVGGLLQYSRDFLNDERARKSLVVLFSWLDSKQRIESGSWGGYSLKTKKGLSYEVQTGYHIWNLYFFERRQLLHGDAIVESCIRTQNPLGGFGSHANSSACEDIDSIDPLARAYRAGHKRSKVLRATLERAIPWILVNLNSDGGYVFRRNEPLVYGHRLLSSNANESGLFPTWFRTLSLAYVSASLKDSPPISFDWKFLECPGYQFWK